MKRVFAVVACVLAMTSVSFGQDCSDAYDNNLCVYPIPAADAQFAVDGALSAFWADWTGKDYAEMIPPGSCYPGRCNFTGGASDAKLVIKAAGTGRGIYILSTVTDNTWVDRADPTDWGADAIDFYFDSKDANNIYTCTDCRIGGYCTLCTYTTQQFQVWMGATSLPTGCKYQYYDENLWSWQDSYVEFVNMKFLYGMEVDVVALPGGDKAQEWYFPWEKYGQSIAVGTLLDGMQVAFSGGYNDKDGDNANPDCLRWLLKDPWAGDANYWGNFTMQAGMGNVVPGIGIHDKAFKAAAAGKAQKASTAFFTLQGQKITAPLNTLPKGAIVVQRSTMTDGSVVSNVMTMGR